MSANSKIEWTETTWNPVRGCSRVSPGCGAPAGKGGSCYAERDMARKNTNPKVPGCHGFAEFVQINGKPEPRWTGRVELIPDKLTEPLHWRKPRMCFANSMSDLYHKDLPDDARDQVHAVMALTPHITYQVLTKRADVMQAYWSDLIKRGYLISKAMEKLCEQEGREDLYDGMADFPLPNLWLGVSVESRDYLSRIERLRYCPAAVRWASLEPLLSDLGDIKAWLQVLDWVVVGGESGPGARPFDIAWARSIIAQCKAAGVPVFMKQLGACITGLNLDGPPYSSPPRREGFLVHWKCLEDNTFGLCDRKGGRPEEWPEDLRVREYPAGSIDPPIHRSTAEVLA